MSGIISDRQEAHVLYMRLDDARHMKHAEISRKGKDLLFYALRTYYDMGPDEVEIKEGEHGKPYIKGYPNHIHFNISNSGDYVVLITAGIPVGIDIQEKRVMDLDKLGSRIFSADEYRKFLASEDRQDMFFRNWVLKESYTKWTGEGLLRNLGELPMNGWSEFILIDTNYFCAVRAGLPLNLEIEEVNV